VRILSGGRVLITGTTSGIGRALLDHYVSRGVHVIAVNRRRVADLEAQYPSVRFECIDVRSANDVSALVRSLADSAQLPEIFILNAGVNRIDNDESFQLAAYREVVETNLYGVLNFIEPLTALPAQSCERHIVAISSMVNYAGNPFALGYSSSKRALTACFDVWSAMYAGTDLVFKQVMLGPVPTKMYTMDSKSPAWIARIRSLVSASCESTACAVAKFAATRKRRLIYPWSAFLLFRSLSIVQCVLPGLLRGHKTIAGKVRRESHPHG